jgi:hypothetical protein
MKNRSSFKYEYTSASRYYVHTFQVLCIKYVQISWRVVEIDMTERVRKHAEVTSTVHGSQQVDKHSVFF